MVRPVPSRSAANRAGGILRGPHSPEELSEALDVLDAWRAAHARPLAAATVGLRSRVATAGCSQVEISQRLKRIPTIIDKLNREPGMELGRMADIGGCRAILQDLDELARVQARYANDPVTERVRDYVAKPKPDGYRAVHVIVRYHARLIEVQLRTRVQHEWAYTVERVTSRFGIDLKFGGGPVPVREWFAAVSMAMALEERGEAIDRELLQRIIRLKESASPYLQGAG